MAVEEQVGGGQEGGVLHLGGRRGQHPAGRLGAGAELGDGVERHPGSVRAAAAGPTHPYPGPRWQALPMGTTPAVRLATADDLDGMAEALALAFDDDPVMQWLFGAEPPRPMRYTRPVLRHRGSPPPPAPRPCTRPTGTPGAAYWDPPGHWKTSPIEHAAPGAGDAPRASAARTVKALRGLGRMEKAHARAPRALLPRRARHPTRPRRARASAPR